MHNMNFDHLAKEYSYALDMTDHNASNLEVNRVLKKAACNFPSDSPEKLAWFTAALKNPEQKWFVARLMAKINPVPKSLLDDLVLAAMTEPNPSANKHYIIPCVKTFGKAFVMEVMLKYVSNPEAIECNGFEKTAYWLGS
ncbi:hypothetical protein [Enterovibrio norvegicus]|nr:hypothetical protein [Enterovibrio norvegicus]